MKQHTKIYFRDSGLNPFDFTPCEICDSEAVDIHHIDARGMGGDPTGSKDVFGNLMALCRVCHDTYGDISDLKHKLRKIHAGRFPEKLEFKNNQIIEL